VILDFYKEFENIEDFFGSRITRIKTFEWHGRLYTQNTYFGQKVYEMKNFNDPPIDNSKRGSYLNEIVSAFEPYIRSLIEHDVALTLGYVPSSSKIPDEIAHRLAQIFQLPLKSFIQKNSDVPSKQLTAIDEQTFNKYMLDFSKLDKNSTFLIIDDVVGTGATVCEIMHKLYNFNSKINYFLSVVKDVKR
jgi:phosphoribosylpyrophosphate synthetase